jgi:hypothetical protein
MAGPEEGCIPMRSRTLLAVAVLAALVLASAMPVQASGDLPENCRNLETDPDLPERVVCTEQWDGFISCSARSSVPAFSTSNCAFWDEAGLLGDHEHQLLAQADHTDLGLKTIVVAMVWEPSEHSLQPHLQHSIFVNVADTTGMNYTFQDPAALPGLEYRLDADPSDAEFDWDSATDPIPIEFRISAGSDGEPNVVIQQPFTVHYHLFYGDHAPADYSALP